MHTALPSGGIRRLASILLVLGFAPICFSANQASDEWVDRVPLLSICDKAVAAYANADHVWRAVEFVRKNGSRISRIDHAAYDPGPRAALRIATLLVSATKAAYYVERCDICAELMECVFDTKKVRTVLLRNSLDCDDVRSLNWPLDDLRYNACAMQRPNEQPER